MSLMPVTSQRPVLPARQEIHTAPIELFAQIRSKIFFGNLLKDIKALERSITKLGLLSPLIVMERAGKLYIIDGQKRLAAIKRLRFQGQLPRNLHRIPYIYYKDAQERQSPAPALMSNRELYDGVVTAFKQGASPDDIADELYLTRHVVTQIITLSRLTPRLRNYFFEGHLNLEQAQAYAAVPVARKQEDAFDRLGPFAGPEAVLDTVKDIDENKVVPLAARAA